MSSTYTGSGSTIHTSADLMTDGDRPTAQLFRSPLERIFDSLAALSAGVDSLAIKTTGGTFELSAALTLDCNGQPWRWDGDVDVLTGSTFQYQSGSITTFDSGSSLTLSNDPTLNGLFTVSSTGQVTFASGSELAFTGGSEITGTATLASGAALVGAAGSEVRVASADDLIVDGAGSAFSARHSLAMHQQDGAWVPFSGGTGIWVDSAADGAQRAVFALRLLPGDTLTSVTVTVTGQVGVSGHASHVTGTPLRVSVVTVSSSGVQTTLAQDDDSSASAGAYNTPHAITLTSADAPNLLPLTVGADPVLVVVRNEGGAGAEANKTAILSISVNGVAFKFRNSVEYV